MRFLTSLTNFLYVTYDSPLSQFIKMRCFVLSLIQDLQNIKSRIFLSYKAWGELKRLRDLRDLTKSDKLLGPSASSRIVHGWDIAADMRNEDINCISGENSPEHVFHESRYTGQSAEQLYRLLHCRAPRCPKITHFMTSCQLFSLLKFFSQTDLKYCTHGFRFELAVVHEKL